MTDSAYSNQPDSEHSAPTPGGSATLNANPAPAPSAEQGELIATNFSAEAGTPDLTTMGASTGEASDSAGLQPDPESLQVQNNADRADADVQAAMSEMPDMDPLSAPTDPNVNLPD